MSETAKMVEHLSHHEGPSPARPIRHPELCFLSATLTADGWYLEVETHDTGESVALLTWPEGWPREVDADFLRAAGFVVQP